MSSRYLGMGLLGAVLIHVTNLAQRPAQLRFRIGLDVEALGPRVTRFRIETEAR